MQSIVQNKNAETHFFDQFSAAGYTVFTMDGYKRFLAEFIRLAKPTPRDIIFDFGCGTGAFTSMIVNHGFQVTGFDLSPGCIARARASVSGANFSIGDIEHLSTVNASSADIIVFSAVLHHFPNPHPALIEAWRILRPGGRVFAFDPNVGNPAMFLYRDPRSPFYSTRGVTPNERPLERAALVSAFEHAHFNKPFCFAVSGISFVYVESRLAQLFLPIYNALDHLLGATPLAKSIGAFLITVATKPSPP